MKKTVSHWTPYVAFVTAVVFLAFVGGSIASIAELSPTGYIRDAYRAGKAIMEKSNRQRDPFATDLWTPAETLKKGVTVYDPSRAHNGLTLYTSGDAPKAVLIDMDGQVVHEWHKPFSTIWDDTAAVRDPVPDKQTYLNKVHVYPNGDLLAIYIGVGDSPYGYGMVKLDKNSNVIWKNLDHFHHDFSVAPDGHIYGLTHTYRTKPLEGVDHLEFPVTDDFLVVLSPEGRTLKKISLLDALNVSEYRRLLWRVPYYSLADPLHTNAVDIIDEKTAEQLGKKLPVAAEGQVLLSFRELAGGSIALLDVATEQIVWASRGPWLSQHDPDILPSGDIMVFDNRGHFGPDEGQSRLVTIDPASGGIIWQYTGDKDNRFESLIRSDQQPLSNGNILITESNSGRLLEITPGGDIVWEYINPARGGKENKLIAVVSSVDRIDPEDLTADFRAGILNNKLAREELTP